MKQAKGKIMMSRLYIDFINEKTTLYTNSLVNATFGSSKKSC